MLLLWNRLSGSLEFPNTYCVAQADLKTPDPFTSASWDVELQVCATVAGIITGYFLLKMYSN